MKLDQIVSQFKAEWEQLPDERKPSNNQKYVVADAALSAYAMFHMQSPSFLAHQRSLQQRKRRSNLESLFQVRQVPSDGQIRNLLDPIEAEYFGASFWWLLAGLEKSGELEKYRVLDGQLLIALDGVHYHSSENIHCEQCLRRRDKQGQLHYYHSALTPLVVKPGCEHVLALQPEFIGPQDGQEKQDCERNAAKRWLASQKSHFKPHTVVFLGDDLYANQPLCQTVISTNEQSFLFTCKASSHQTLYDIVATLQAGDDLSHVQERHWNGRHGEEWTYRLALDLPLRSEPRAMRVNWLELEIRHEDSGELLFQNAWITNLAVTADNVSELAQAGRTRWKIENEGNNVLKTKGYHLEHNFGHGKQHLATVFFTLNLLAFLTHTIQHVFDASYRLLRRTLAVRRTFFSDLRALTRYIVFDSWTDLYQFMLDGLELAIPPP